MGAERREGRGRGREAIQRGSKWKREGAIRGGGEEEGGEEEGGVEEGGVEEGGVEEGGGGGAAAAGGSNREGSVGHVALQHLHLVTEIFFCPDELLVVFQGQHPLADPQEVL
eukprot:768615-Hanusia_phi.AAC.1